LKAKIRVLLIEDNPGDVGLIEGLFRNKSNQFSLLHTASLSEGLALINDNKADVVLLDLGLPENTGLDTLREINPSVHTVPIIVLTGLDDEIIGETAMREGAQDYLIKGKIDSNILRRSIRHSIERKQAQITLDLSEKNYRDLFQQFRGLLDADPDSLMLLSPDLTISWANKNVEKRAGMSQAALLGRRCYTILNMHAEPCEDCPVLKSFKTGQIENSVVESPEGPIREIRAVPIKNEAGTVVNVIDMARDITEHRKLEAQLRQAQKMEAIGSFASGVAHDFNNLLNIIVGYGALMKMNEGDHSKNNQYLDEILAASERATHLTRGLLTFGRKSVMVLRPVNLNDAISGVSAMLRRVIGEDIELRVELHPEPLVIMADAGQIEQVVLNFATNTRDAMPSGGTFTIRTELKNIDKHFIDEHRNGEPGMYAVISAEDTGHGMDESTRLRIFEPFFTTKEFGKGTGLGLSIAYGIVKQHKGYIECISRPGKGARFVVYFPLMHKAAEVRLAAGNDAPIQGGTETILLAEDDQNTRAILRIALEQFGYSVIEAVDGENAVLKYREQKEKIKLLLFDVIMPKINGLYALETIRTITPNIRALFISGYDADLLKARGINEDIRYITKPISPILLLRTVREILNETREST
jgi:two-component system, cell cycle sensor histidine kinase and response regulator CckA